jgi:zinc transport system substrate-binding protein
MRIALIRLAVTAAAVVPLACGGDVAPPRAAGEPLRVVAAFYPLAEAARQAGGPDVDVTDLTPAGAEPHDLELTPGQAADLADADVVLVVGRDFQPAVEDVADGNDGTHEVLDALGVPDSERDVHLWLDPRRMREVVDAVAGWLAAADPEHAGAYRERAARYGRRLAALDRELGDGLRDCARRTIVTAHDAFGWLADRYGLEQHAIAGLAPDDEPSADRIAELADLVEELGVTTVFTETLVPADLAETLAREAGVRTAVLDPIESAPDAGDYVSAMRANLAELRRALACT